MTIDRDRARDESAATGDSSEADVHLSWSATFDALSHRYRREVLRVGSDADDRTATVDELVTAIVERAAERTDESPQRDRVATALSHVHLPKLSEAGLVDYDARSRTVHCRRCDRVEDVLERVRTEDADREFAR